MRYLTLIFLFALGLSVHGQNLLKSRHSGYMTYIFRITDSEARKIYQSRSEKWMNENGYFHTLTDSFPSESGYTKRLQAGHYLYAVVADNQFMARIESVQNVSAQLVNNNTEFCLKLYDSTGTDIGDAEVRMGARRLAYDSKIKGYIAGNTGKNRILAVRYRGVTSYFSATTTKNRHPLRYMESFLFLSNPLKYIWVPAKFVIAAPYLAIRDAAKGNWYSIGGDLRYYWPRNGIGGRNSYDYQYSSSRPGYMVFSKPIYLPHDTVRYKAFILSRHAKPLKKELSLKLENSDYEKVLLNRVKPLTPGNYNGEFVIADTLKLDLDRSYSLYLMKGKRKTLMKEDFKYEDYELKNISLTVRPDSIAQLKGKKFSIHIRATDENELNLQDGRLELCLRSTNLAKQFAANVFLRDTLLFIKQKLEPAGETVVTVPDSVFPAANLSYRLNVSVRRSDNEYKDYTTDISYFNTLREVSYILRSDSIFFILKENGRPVSGEAVLTGIDKLDFRGKQRKINLPCGEKINPFYSSYRIIEGGKTTNLEVKPDEALISTDSEERGDSLKVSVSNPRKIPFAWFLYRANKLTGKGSGTEFSFKERIAGNSKYYLTIAYLWSGVTLSSTYTLTGNRQDLKIAVDQPSLVFPGQTVKLGLTVTDYAGRPVEGVDLTALSYTKKFTGGSPSVYRFTDMRKAKSVRKTFRLSDKKSVEATSVSLDYDRWKKLFTLDTVEYYKFLHHKNEIYLWSYQTSDRYTQFAPFVVKNGKPENISVVYVDRFPVYLDWVGGSSGPYSFRVDSGYHFVEFRLRDKVIKIDSVYFKYGNKLIMSVNDVAEPKKYTAFKRDPFYSPSEKVSLARYLFPYRNNFGDYPAWLRQDGRIFVLSEPVSESDRRSDYSGYNNYRNDRSLLAGPVRPYQAKLTVQGKYDHYFDVEPDFEFEFSPSVIMMRTADKAKLIPNYLSGTSALRLADFPITEKSITDRYNEYLFQKKLASAKFNLPKSTLSGRGKLIIRIDSLGTVACPYPMFLILKKADNGSLRSVYPGTAGEMENLEPGLWSLYLFYRGDKYFRYDSIPVKAEGRNYTQLYKPGKQVHDTLSYELGRTVEDQCYSFFSSSQKDFQDYLRQMQRQQSLMKYSGEGVMISGQVTSREEGGLPGVTVMVKGTTFGTVTDVNGYYSLLVPFDNRELIFAYIGYSRQEVWASASIVDAVLVPETLALSEVVVTAYGVQRRREVTGSVSVSNVLNGRASGLSINTINNGINPDQKITLRGTRSFKDNIPPLIIIDGVPYHGNLDELDPSMISNIDILNGESAAAIYGSAASSGVLVINTNGMAFNNPKLRALLKGAVYDSTFMQQVAGASSVRTQFRDWGYWKPDLVTDKNGKASFEVKFPDDVTSWKTYVLAMNGRKQSGSAEGLVKSYKPLMAQLYTPRFLVEGDSSNLIGKVLNYTADSVTVNIHSLVNGIKLSDKTAGLKNAITDLIAIKAGSADSMTVRYAFDWKNGYFDGEERKIPVFRKGLEMTAGKFFVLNGDTTVSFRSDPKMGKGQIYAQADKLDIIGSEIAYLRVYSYECNEQMASKLIALLCQEKIDTYNGKHFINKTLPNRLIRNIEYNQNADGCWGWWDKSGTSMWVTMHVVKALTMARQMGYLIMMNDRSLTDYLAWRLGSGAKASEKLELLYAVSGTGAKVDYNKYLANINPDSLYSVNDRFRLIELKQKLGMQTDIDSVLKYEHRTMFGSVWFGKPDKNSPFYENDVQLTLSAYRIIKLSKAKDEAYLERIRNYFFEIRSSGRWMNTFESASVIETIMPDLLIGKKGDVVKSSLTLSGSVSKTVTEFPFSVETAAGDSVTVTKKGTFPVYLTSYQHYWKTDPAADTGWFTLSTRFEGGTERLKAGKPVKMHVSLKVNKEAKYVMLEIPVPGGCSYDSKDNYFYMSDHTEFFRDHVAVFFNLLKERTYEYEVNLLPRYTGNYTLNPAKAELMYFPTFSSNNSLKKVIIN
jgi:alpha-2-macroglobulin